MEEIRRHREEALVEVLYGCKNCRKPFSTWSEEKPKVCPFCGSQNIEKIAEYDLA